MPQTQRLKDCQVIDAELYPDILAHHGLAAALTNAAYRSSIELTFTGPEGSAQGFYATTRSDRGFIDVTLGLRERVFLISIAKEREVWSSGSTSELSEVIAVANFWNKGATLRQLHEQFPFMTYTRLAQGYEDGNPIEAQWDDVLGDPELTLIRPLLQAARANERLGRMFPAVTHLTIARFLINTRRNAPQVQIALLADGGFKVDSDWVDTPQQVSTIAEAIDAAVAQLPK